VIIANLVRMYSFGWILRQNFELVISTDWKQKIVISLRCATTAQDLYKAAYNSLQKPQLDLEWVVLMEENAKTNLVARLNFMKSGSCDAQGA
jgi:hypothetical protein